MMELNIRLNHFEIILSHLECFERDIQCANMLSDLPNCQNSKATIRMDSGSRMLWHAE